MPLLYPELKLANKFWQLMGGICGELPQVVKIGLNKLFFGFQLARLVSLLPVAPLAAHGASSNSTL